MPAAAGLTLWSFMWFCLKWNLLFVCVVLGSVLLLKIGYPLLILPLLGLFVALFWRDAKRVSRGMRGRIVRRVGGYAEVPPSLQSTIVGWLVCAAIVTLLAFYGGYVLLALMTVGIVFTLLRPFAVRYGWFEEGYITARLNRPRFVDEEYRGSVDPTGGVGGRARA